MGREVLAKDHELPVLLVGETVVRGTRVQEVINLLQSGLLSVPLRRGRRDDLTGRPAPSARATSRGSGIDGSLPDETIRAMIEDSYDLVLDKLPPARRRALGRRDVP